VGSAATGSGVVTAGLDATGNRVVFTDHDLASGGVGLLPEFPADGRPDASGWPGMAGA
jgi:hypothetical protein